MKLPQITTMVRTEHPPDTIGKRWMRSIAKESQPGRAVNTLIAIKSFIKASTARGSKM
jgi:hypothetical protein